MRLRTSYSDRTALESAWTTVGRAGRSESFREFTERLDRVAFFLAGALMDEGFRLFHNGGTPLFEKRRNGRIFELVVRARGRSLGAMRGPVTLEAVVSDPKLRAQREAYWTPASQAPALIARCHVGELDIPPRIDVYDAFAPLDAWSTVVEELRELAAPWFARFVRPSALVDRLRSHGIPFVARDVALELMILERGEDAGVEFLFDLFDGDADFERLVRSEHDRIARALPPDLSLDAETAQIAAIVSRLGLLNRG